MTDWQASGRTRMLTTRCGLDLERVEVYGRVMDLASGRDGGPPRERSHFHRRIIGGRTMKANLTILRSRAARCRLRLIAVGAIEPAGHPRHLPANRRSPSVILLFGNSTGLARPTVQH